MRTCLSDLRAHGALDRVFEMSLRILLADVPRRQLLRRQARLLGDRLLIRLGQREHALGVSAPSLAHVSRTLTDSSLPFLWCLKSCSPSPAVQDCFCRLSSIACSSSVGRKEMASE